MTETMTETINRDALDPRILAKTIRGWNDVLAIWRLCRNTACMRASACCGADPERCFHAHLCLLPDSMIAWFYAIADAQRGGLSYDEAIAGMEGTIAENALEDWHAAIADSKRFLAPAS